MELTEFIELYLEADDDIKILVEDVLEGYPQQS